VTVSYVTRVNLSSERFAHFDWLTPYYRHLSGTPKFEASL